MNETKQKLDFNSKLKLLIEELENFSSSPLFVSQKEDYLKTVTSTLLPHSQFVELFSKNVTYLINYNKSYLLEISSAFPIFTKRAQTKHIANLIKDHFLKTKSKLKSLASKLDKFSPSFISKIPASLVSDWYLSIQQLQEMSLSPLWLISPLLFIISTQ